MSAQPTIEPPPPSGRTFIGVVGKGALFESLDATLLRRGYPLVRAHDAASAQAIADHPQVALVVLALPLPSGSARRFLGESKALLERFPILVVGADDEVTDAMDAFELGATEYLRNADSSADFLASVGVALGARKTDRHLQYLRQKDAPGRDWDAVVGDSPALMRVVSMLKQVAVRTQRGATPIIFIDGETGTGKGFIAKCVHYTSARKTRTFVDVNCAALPVSLLESELFGHERGAFTDAKTARRGLFETADGGSLFLDEIGAIPLDVQAKLLTAIEERRVRRIGARASEDIDVQIIAATHEDLRRKVEQGTFREDLFHRLNVVAVTVPPLRERGRDVLLLAETFVRSFCNDYGIPCRPFSSGAKEFLTTYSWPGNVRELRNQIERIILLENDEVIRAEHFRAAGESGAGRIVVRKSGTRLKLTLPEEGVSFTDLEREVLREALERCEGNVSRAARFLSISRQTLMYRMKKYALTGTGDT